CIENVVSFEHGVRHVVGMIKDFVTSIVAVFNDIGHRLTSIMSARPHVRGKELSIQYPGRLVARLTPHQQFWALGPGGDRLEHSYGDEHHPAVLKLGGDLPALSIKHDATTDHVANVGEQLRQFADQLAVSTPVAALPLCPKDACRRRRGYNF